MTDVDTISTLIESGEDDATAIGAPGQAPLSYGDLRLLVRGTAEDLAGLGIGHDDVVAMVLPNGPEMAAAFVAFAAATTTAPLNPSYREDELRFYLADLECRLLVVTAEVGGAAREVAADLGIEVAELVSDDRGPAGDFRLRGGVGTLRDVEPGPARPEHTALLLHTSGTTSRPKLVPLTQANLCASACSIARTLRLEPQDRCLNVMPLFHIHGLMAAVLASLAAGASVSCSPGFNALRFFSWLEEVAPTWYTAVPTMHQAILARAERNRRICEQARLRFVRSSSASLPPRVMRALEETFAAPVIESYGMTEAAHQMASNPLPPAARKPGTVGPAAGPEIAIMGPEGDLLPRGATGEVVIRGANVTAGYLNNPAANAAAFTAGWFRTGDQGVLDEDGYLRLTGRLKEIINRGGEKISPREVDEVLLDHPAVQQAVTFALAHEKLGEEVAAAIVLRPGARASESELRQFAQLRLTDFKVPRRFVFLDEIPKGPTGKLQRLGLAKRLGLESSDGVS